MKKANCRRTEEEKRVHDWAVGMRKMTDTQLWKAWENNAKQAEKMDTTAINVKILASLRGISGLGSIRISKIMEVVSAALDDNIN